MKGNQKLGIRLRYSQVGAVCGSGLRELAGLGELEVCSTSVGAVCFFTPGLLSTGGQRRMYGASLNAAEKHGGSAMSRRDPLRCGTITRFLALFCVAAFTPGAKVQSQEVMIRGTGKMVPVCKLADLDSNVSFFSADTDFIMAFNLQNISESPCVPQPSAAFPQVDQDQIREANRWVCARIARTASRWATSRT